MIDYIEYITSNTERKKIMKLNIFCAKMFDDFSRKFLKCFIFLVPLKKFMNIKDNELYAIFKLH